MGIMNTGPFRRIMEIALPILKFGTAPAAARLKKLQTRLSALEQLDHAALRERTRKTFGKPLRPQQVVDKILGDVRDLGDKAVFDYAKRLDGIELSPRNFRVTLAERKAAFKRVAPELRKALELAARRIADYQKRLLPKNLAPKSAPRGPAGVRTGLLWSPLNRVGLYVPGGTAAYPSTLLMVAVPAQVAGVKQIAIATPCGRDGKMNDTLLCAAEILGLDEIYKIGGVQAIGAFAYGTQSIPAVDKIAGPGNLFVMLAKRAVFGHVDIDGLFGPSEVLVIADSSADARFIAADLLAQAEHDTLASCVLLTDSAKLAQSVSRELDAQLATLPRREIAVAALRDWGLILLMPNLDSAAKTANSIAPEHLELMTRRNKSLLPRLTCAGAIFAGPHATEPLGDYVAGPSHTLPTGGTAKAFSGLSVYTFMRRTSLIEADAKGLAELAGSIEALASAEGLEAHRRAVAMRRKP